MAKLLRLGGIVPEQRAARLREIARKVKSEFGGDLKAELKKRVQEKYQASKGIHSARKILREFPVIGEPSADKILLFSKLAPVAAVPSAFLRAPIRLRFCREWKNYAADYRKVREKLDAERPRTSAATQRACLL